VGMALASEARAERERKGIPPPKVAFLEWTEPTYVGGHWTPELIEMAGGYARTCSPLHLIRTMCPRMRSLGPQAQEL